MAVGRKIAGVAVAAAVVYGAWLRPERGQLKKSHDELQRKIEQERSRRSQWGLSLGNSFRYYRRVTAGRIFLSYAAFNISLFIAGVVLVILGDGVLRELGIAIVVGSIFASGSFIAQWWSIEIQHELDFNDRVSGHIVYQQRLGGEVLKIEEKLDRLTARRQLAQRVISRQHPGRALSGTQRARRRKHRSGS